MLKGTCFIKEIEGIKLGLTLICICLTKNQSARFMVDVNGVSIWSCYLFFRIAPCPNKRVISNTESNYSCHSPVPFSIQLFGCTGSEGAAHSRPRQSPPRNKSGIKKQGEFF